MKLFNNNKLFILHSIIFLFSSCATKIPFTSELKKQNNLQEEDIKQMQFYLSDNIILSNSESSGTKNTDNKGNLILNNKYSLNKIIIKKGTKGVVEKVISEDMFLVSFEEGNFIVFGNKTGIGRYKLMSKKWNNNQAEVEYNGRKYISNNGSESTFLIIKSRNLNKIISNQRTVKGKKIKK